MRLRLPTLRKNKKKFISRIPEKFATDLRSVGPIHVCTCGCTVFKTLVSFEEYDISWWYLEGECLNCGNMAALPCPIDDPNYSPDCD